jgi:hypothetical protein
MRFVIRLLRCCLPLALIAADTAPSGPASPPPDGLHFVEALDSDPAATGTQR